MTDNNMPNMLLGVSGLVLTVVLVNMPLPAFSMPRPRARVLLTVMTGSCDARASVRLLHTSRPPCWPPFERAHGGGGAREVAFLGVSPRAEPGLYYAEMLTCCAVPALACFLWCGLRYALMSDEP